MTAYPSPTFETLVSRSTATLPFTNTGTGAAARTVDSKLKDEWLIAGRDFGLPNSGDCATAINNAIARASSVGGGKVWLPPITMVVGSTIDNKYSRVLVCSSHEGGVEPSHNVGSPSYGAVIVPAFAGTVLKHRSVYGSSSTTVNSGGGFSGLRVIGNSVATRLLEVDSISGGLYALCLDGSVGSEAALFKTGIEGTDFGESPCVQNMTCNLAVRQEDSAHCVVFQGSSNANISINDRIWLDLLHVNGDGLRLVNADNNMIWMRAYRPSGSGAAVRSMANALSTQSARANYWKWLSCNGDIIFEGTGTAASPSNGYILFLDQENSSPLPTLGTAASCPVLNMGWAAYTPTITAGAGSLTSVSATGRYLQTGKLMTAHISVTLTTNGTGSSYLQTTLPAPSASGVTEGILSGLETSLTGKSVTGLVTTSAATWKFYDGTYPGADGSGFRMKLEYEVA